MIKVENLNKFFGEQQVLKDIHLHIQKGEVFGIVGHSGAGKSTLLRCFNGLENYDSGSVEIMGQEVKNLREADLLVLRSKMGMIFQNFNLLTRRTVFDNVALPLELWGTKKQKITARVTELLQLVGLEDKTKERIQSLSGGQKQRVGIARALALNPDILLCDEATSALDPRTTNSILDLLEDINRRLGITIVLVTHQMEVVKRLCHHTLLLDGGITCGHGKTEDLFLAPQAAFKKLIEEDFTLIEGGINLRLGFPRTISEACIVTSMARELNIDFSIVGGKLERYQDDVFGFLIINIQAHDLDKVISYIQPTGLVWENLNA